MHSIERAWAEVNLDNIIYNYTKIKQSVEPRGIFAVIKADAYGHGAVPVAKALIKAGADRFAIATAQEALQLRKHGIAQQILLLGMDSSKSVFDLVTNNIILTIGSIDDARKYAEVLKKHGLRARIHLKVDSGMGRLGFSVSNPSSALAEIVELANMTCFKIEGIYSHFAIADELEGEEYTKQQYAIFTEFVSKLKDKKVVLPLAHCANSAAVISKRYSWLDAVRPGIMLYGSNPCKHAFFDLRPAMSLRARIVQVKAVKKGETVSYGRQWTAPRDSIIAAASIGYADGLLRGLSGKMNMIVNGYTAPQVGRICMDMCMLDVTGIPNVQVGDAATIFGRDGDQVITADDVAEKGGTISYEILCAVGKRIPRFYDKCQQVEENSHLPSSRA